MKDWRIVLSLNGEVTREQIEHQYRVLAKRRHPDLGGSTEAMQELSEAKTAALAWAALPKPALVPIQHPDPAWQQANAAQNAMNQQWASAAMQGFATSSLGGMGGPALNRYPGLTCQQDQVRRMNEAMENARAQSSLPSYVEFTPAPIPTRIERLKSWIIDTAYHADDWRMTFVWPVIICEGICAFKGW